MPWRVAHWTSFLLNTKSPVLRSLRSGHRAGTCPARFVRSSICSSSVSPPPPTGISHCPREAKVGASSREIWSRSWPRDDVSTGRQCGVRITGADWRLFATLIRFDSVYVGHLKCNLQRLSECLNLFAHHMSDLHQRPRRAQRGRFR